MLCSEKKKTEETSLGEKIVGEMWSVWAGYSSARTGGEVRFNVSAIVS